MSIRVSIFVLLQVLLLSSRAEPSLGFTRKVVTSQCGAVASDGADDTAAIQSCIDAVGANGGAIYFPPGEYHVAGSLRMTAHQITLYSDSRGSAKLRHSGCGGHSTLITAGGSSPIINGGIRGLSLQADDSSCARTALRVIDSSWFALDDVTIQGFHDATGSSQGVRIQGREGFQARRLRVLADRPIVLAENPNYPTIDVDHFHFEDVYSTVLSTTVQRWHIEIEPTVNLANAIFDGTNAFVRGCGILQWVGNSTVSVSHNLRIANVRHEQPMPATCDRSIYLDMNGLPLQRLMIENVHFVNTMANAIYLANVTSVTISDSVFAPTSPKNFLNVPAGVRFLELRNNYTTRYGRISAPGMIWLEKFGGKDCCPPTIDTGILVPSGQAQP